MILANLKGCLLMKLLLINPYFNSLIYSPTLGLSFLATYIKEHSRCEVAVIEPVTETLDAAELLVKIKETDFLGLTCYTESRFQCFDFAKKAKVANPRCQIIVGGPHVMSLSKQVLEHYSFVDIVIRGEAEDALLEIINGKALSEVNGITWRRNAEVIQNSDRIFCRDLSLFHLDYSLIYPEIKNWKDKEIPYAMQQVNHLPIISSRGCPYRCTFCASNNQWGKLWRGLAPEKMVEELTHLVNKYNIGYFRFYDALFIGSDSQAYKFCDLLEQARLKITFRIDIRVGTKPAVLKRLREVGCSVVGFGIESGSDRILKRINKGITRKQIDETIDVCKTLGYWLLGFFMISLPDETPEDFKKTAELFHRFDVFNLQFFKIHPDTSFYEELKAKGELSDEIWFETERGEEIFYSKETFPSSNYYRSEVEKRAKAIYLSQNIRKPFTAIKNHGLLRGCRTVLFSMIQLTLLPSKRATDFLDCLKRGWLGKLFKSRRYWR